VTRKETGRRWEVARTSGRSQKKNPTAQKNIKRKNYTLVIGGYFSFWSSYRLDLYINYIASQFKYQKESTSGLKFVFPAAIADHMPKSRVLMIGDGKDSVEEETMSQGTRENRNEATESSDKSTTNAIQ
jgi:hypothetical protein